MEVQIRCLAIVQQFRAWLRLFDGRVCRRSVYTRANVVRKCDKVYTHVPDASPSSSRANLHGHLKLRVKHEIKSRKTPDYDIPTTRVFPSAVKYSNIHESLLEIRRSRNIFDLCWILLPFHYFHMITLFLFQSQTIFKNTRNNFYK